MIAPPPIEVQSPHFDGSLATLFQCVREHKVNLLDVPLLPICEAYFTYLIQQANPNLDEAAAALTALAYLLERKAWLLLPVEEPEPELEESMELLAPTSHEYAAAIEALRVWQEDRAQTFFRSPDAGPDPYELPYTLSDVSSADLARALEKVLARANPEPAQVLNKARRSLAEMMKVVFAALTSEWRTLDLLIPHPFTRNDVVYWFLALLELVRLGQASVRLENEDVEFARAQLSLFEEESDGDH